MRVHWIAPTKADTVSVCLNSNPPVSAIAPARELDTARERMRDWQKRIGT
jgi:hypothetical protein